MESKIKTVKLSEIKLNPDNPRTITGKAMENLVKSLQDFPEMMKLREIVVDESMTVLGGNMRLLALQKSGAKDCTAKIVKGLTPDQKREFVIKDNAAFGEWDMDALANSWDDLPLFEWGVNVPTIAEICDYEEKPVFWFKKTHILLSFNPEKLNEIQEHLEKILEVDGIEYDQTSN